MTVLIAIDDTDNLESIGTGRLSRTLADELTKKGLVTKTSVTRHQLLVHPDIPYTSHNSSACIEGEVNGTKIEHVTAAARAFLLENFHEGANPGLCVAKRVQVPETLQHFGLRAQQEVLTIEEARKLADRLGIFTWWHGETGQGCIGAMAGVGLRSTGNDGRFIGLPGIREVKGVVRVGELLSECAIKRVSALSGEALADNELVDTQNWIRPSLHNGEVVLFVVKVEDVWRAPEKKKRKS